MNRQNLTPDQALQQAVACHRAGQLQDAERLYRAILAVQPQHPDANHNLGVLAVGVGQVHAALPFFEQALAVQPRAAQFWLSYIDALLRLQRVKPARKAIQAACRNGVPAQTLSACKARLKTLPAAPAQPDHGTLRKLETLFQQGRFVEAEAAARAVIARYPDHAFAWAVLAPSLQQQQRAAEAVPVYQQALRLQPHSSMTQGNFADCLNALGQYQAAMEQAQNALALDRSNVAAWINLGISYGLLDRYEEAMHCFQQALELEPGQIQALHGMCIIYINRNDFQSALEYAEQALVHHPEYVDALNSKAEALILLGRLTQARQVLDQALALSPHHPEALSLLAQLQKPAPDDPAFTALEAAIRTANPDKRRTLHFALGPMYEQTGQYCRAFGHYQSGNALRRAKTGRYDQENDAVWFHVVRCLLPAQTFFRLAGSGSPSRRPIFVLGFPRSGTTLTEQILAGHSKVFGAGELGYFHREALALPAEIKGNVASVNTSRPIEAHIIKRMAQAYLNILSGINAQSEYVVDKTPHNFERLGLIALCFPKATIVHVERNPVDTCLSCFFQNFDAIRHRYSDDLVELGTHYLYYRSMMTYWQSVLPGRVHTLCYEDLVSRPETEIPALLATCGLDLEEACLTPHLTERSVITASKTQVRRPIHKKSIEKWRRYEQELQPLLEVLRDGGISV